MPPFLTQLFLSKVISCSRAIVSSNTGLQLTKSITFYQVHELGKCRLWSMKEFELGEYCMGASLLRFAS